MASTTAPPVADPTSIPWNIYVANQDFNVTGLDGTPVTLSMADVNGGFQADFRQCSVAGFIVGFSAMLMILLALLTNREKARRPIFILNYLALIFTFFRSVAYLVMFNSSYQGIAQNFLGANAQYPVSTWSPAVIQAVLTPFIYLTMLFSLVLQVRVVFAAEPRSQKIVTIVGSVAALFLFGLGWHQVSLLIRAVLLNEIVWTNWTYDCLRIGIMVFVGVSCLVFLYKLWVAIRRRKRMGFKKFGPLQVLFILFAQCLVVPLVVYILDFTVAGFKNLSNLAQCILICSLPLSSVWASHESESEHKHGNIMTTDSDLTQSRSSRSSRFRGKFRALMGGKQSDSHSNPDLEKAPSYSEKSARTDRTDRAPTPDSS